jgi:crotonobetainyl-CoA:carnitine CoA-transferase CaiB-like acyl-CoA transferase
MDEPAPGKMFLNGRLPCYGLYRTKEGRYMSLGALEPKFWQNFCTAVGRDDLRQGQFGGPEVMAEVREIFAGYTQAEWIELMRDHDACCEPVLSLKEAVESDLVNARNLTSVGSDGLRYLASPLKLHGSPRPAEKPAPELGEHTREVLSDLGLSTQDMDALADQGVL